MINNYTNHFTNRGAIKMNRYNTQQGIRNKNGAGKINILCHLLIIPLDDKILAIYNTFYRWIFKRPSGK